MSSIVVDFLSTELTKVPKFLRGILGSNSNSALCNGIIWLSLFWIILYVCYDKLINVLLKHPEFPQYLRSRLTNSIWDLCMHACFLLSYYFHITNKYPDNGWLELKFFEQQQDSVSLLENITFAGLCSCLLANGGIQGVQRSYLCLVKFAALAVACSSAYILGFVDLSFTLAALWALTGMFDDLTRLSFCWFYKKSETCKLLVDSMFASSLMVFCTVYFYVIPLACLIPLGSMRLPGNADLVRLALFISLLCWINLVIYKSPSLNLIFHQLYHLKKSRTAYASLSAVNGRQFQSMALVCLGSGIECSLFPPGSDDGFLMAFLRSEETKRKRLVNVRIRRRNKPMLTKTLKYILALKRKLSLRIRRAISELSSEDSESDSDTTLDSDSDSSTSQYSFVQRHTPIETVRRPSEEVTLPLVDREEDIETIGVQIGNDPLDLSIIQQRVENVEDSA
ncbi:hypothetical protein HUJ04_006096 [Dendroctonus ponderosae]|uniref:Transmembrane protein n=1 Tax=Dendroctonus ponderosae TaxID=77166 RepID=A0AAR5PR07_DENPD|nr:hypothetical protein HUJ04_006096 [Dendroctonus ponderosae]